MRYHLFLHYGWFLQNLGKDFIPTNMHTTVGISFGSNAKPFESYLLLLQTRKKFLLNSYSLVLVIVSKRCLPLTFENLSSQNKLKRTRELIFLLIRLSMTFKWVAKNWTSFQKKSFKKGNYLHCRLKCLGAVNFGCKPL